MRGPLNRGQKPWSVLSVWCKRLGAAAAPTLCRLRKQLKTFLFRWSTHIHVLRAAAASGLESEGVDQEVPDDGLGFFRSALRAEIAPTEPKRTLAVTWMLIGRLRSLRYGAPGWFLSSQSPLLLLLLLLLLLPSLSEWYISSSESEQSSMVGWLAPVSAMSWLRSAAHWPH